MFEKGQILRNKKRQSLVIYILDEEGNGIIVESSQPEKRGTTMKCTNIKFYDHEPKENCLKYKAYIYSKEKITKSFIKNYL